MSTVISMLRDMYTEDKNVSNEVVLSIVQKEFPDSKATTKSVITWKNMLRAEGIDIPKQAAGRKPKRKERAKV